MATDYILPFEQIGKEDIARVGGKGANLGEMTRAGFPVPSGFCLTTAAFRRFIESSNAAEEVYALLADLPPGDVEAVRRVGQQVRDRLLAVPMPADIATALLEVWLGQGADHAYAVRSSATAEDLPGASFAGQQDTFLNVRGRDALLESVRACWVSLFTDRAILYRAKNGFDHQEVALSVVVQRMVMPEISGIMFTADPISGHRLMTSIDASYGLGEALVAGLVTPDLYKVDRRTMQIAETQIADKHLAIRPKPEGGVFHEELIGDIRTAQVLTEEQIYSLAEIGVRIEAHYGGTAQDIEWCIEEDELYIVQSRPITTLFPIPEPYFEDGSLSVFFSISHAQGALDPIPPMGISMWQILLPFGRPKDNPAHNPYIAEAGGRMYADISPLLRFALARPEILSAVDPYAEQLLGEITNRDEFMKGKANRKHKVSLMGLMGWFAPLLWGALIHLFFKDPAGKAESFNDLRDSHMAKVELRLAPIAPGLERLELSRDLMGIGFFEMVLMSYMPALIAGGIAREILVKLTHNRADPDGFDALWRGLPDNVTVQMDLAIGDLADILRQHPALIAHLKSGELRETLATLNSVGGGSIFLSAWDGFIADYGIRAPAEIDISRPRWHEDPTSLLQMIIGNAGHGDVGAHRAHHAAITAEGVAAGERLIAVAGQGAGGFIKARIARRLVAVTRGGFSIREHPKLFLVQMLAAVKRVLLEAADILHKQDRLDAADDIWLLDLHEAIAVFQNPADDPRPRIVQRKAAMEDFKNLNAPRVITSDGEIPRVKHNIADLPEGALPGSSVSAGVVEGMARVVLDPRDEVLNPGEILIAPFTDPGWTPLFINAAGLVMEVGGLMTHGSVVAREYGIPAIVGVENATQIIKTGQRIRVHGDQGYVEILDGESDE